MLIVLITRWQVLSFWGNLSRNKSQGLSRNTCRKIGSNAFAKVEGSCPFLSETARRKKSKKSLSSNWAENLAESNKGAMVEGVERALSQAPNGTHLQPLEDLESKNTETNESVTCRFLSRKRWSCGEFTYLVPLGCSSGRTKPVRRTKLILDFRRRKAGRSRQIVHRSWLSSYRWRSRDSLKGF